MNKKTFWTILVIVIVLIIIWVFLPKTPNLQDENNDLDNVDVSTTTPVDPNTEENVEVDQGVEENLGQDASSSIDDQLEGINVDDLEDEFQDINEDLEDL